MGVHSIPNLRSKHIPVYQKSPGVFNSAPLVDKSQDFSKIGNPELVKDLMVARGVLAQLRVNRARLTTNIKTADMGALGKKMATLSVQEETFTRTADSCFKELAKRGKESSAQAMEILILLNDAKWGAQEFLNELIPADTPSSMTWFCQFGWEKGCAAHISNLLAFRQGREYLARVALCQLDTAFSFDNFHTIFNKAAKSDARFFGEFVLAFIGCFEDEMFLGIDLEKANLILSALEGHAERLAESEVCVQVDMRIFLSNFPKSDFNAQRAAAIYSKFPKRHV